MCVPSSGASSRCLKGGNEEYREEVELLKNQHEDHAVWYACEIVREFRGVANRGRRDPGKQRGYRPVREGRPDGIID